MRHHYIVSAIMTPHPNDCLCPVGALCAEEELNATLRGMGVKSYKIKSIDREPVAEWEKSAWVATGKA